MADYQHYSREEASQEREVEIDTSTNYAMDRPSVVPFNFSPNYKLENMP